MTATTRRVDLAAFEKMLLELVNSPNAYGLDVAKALAIALCVKLAPADDTEFAHARERVLRAIRVMLIGIEPTWRDHATVDSTLNRIDQAIWPLAEIAPGSDGAAANNRPETQ
jgi:hypothetical protein